MQYIEKLKTRGILSKKEGLYHSEPQIYQYKVADTPKVNVLYYHYKKNRGQLLRMTNHLALFHTCIVTFTT